MNIFKCLLCLLVLCLCLPPILTGQQSYNKLDEDLLIKAKKLSQEFIIIDSHLDVPYRLWKKWEDISVHTESGHFDYPRARMGGLDVAFMAIFIPTSYQEKGGAKALTDSLLDMVYGFVQKWPDKFVIVTSPQQIKEYHGTGKILLPLGIENGAAIEDDIENIKHFFARGIRYITLTHKKNNRICDSSNDEIRKWKGLSPFGRKVVQKMNRLGIMIDVSHISDESFSEVMEITEAPVIASHSSCRYFTPGFERNLSDEMIKKIVETGGVVQIAFGVYFMKSSKVSGYVVPPQNINMNDNSKKDNFTISDLVDHVDHVVQIVGVDYVGFGSDFDGTKILPEGVKDVTVYPDIIYHLLKRGYSEDDIRKICGTNFLRVWEKVEEISKKYSDSK